MTQPKNEDVKTFPVDRAIAFSTLYGPILLRFAVAANVFCLRSAERLVLERDPWTRRNAWCGGVDLQIEVLDEPPSIDGLGEMPRKEPSDDAA